MLPPRVARAIDRAHELGFQLSSEPPVGQLLSALAAAVPPSGRILELGTGAGVGLAWLVEGLNNRSDVEVITVDLDGERQRAVQLDAWPEFVRFEVGDGATVVGASGTFNLVFADAPGGKTTGLDRTIAALAPGGILVVDDMKIWPDGDALRHASINRVKDQLGKSSELVLAEIDFSSGVILAVKRRG
ncbi:MAG TPA: class I SAM-dependent methyltransferase [Acidimicrobiia bacterium]|nr:class I SAM-dependent methyltransferase [Acidimicrobiia bacterium]